MSSYECSAVSITVCFHDGSAYLYTYESAGAAIIDQMKQLAYAGQGLNSFINRHARKLYERKLR